MFNSPPPRQGREKNGTRPLQDDNPFTIIQNMLGAVKTELEKFDTNGASIIFTLLENVASTEPQVSKEACIKAHKIIRDQVMAHADLQRGNEIAVHLQQICILLRNELEETPEDEDEDGSGKDHFRSRKNPRNWKETMDNKIFTIAEYHVKRLDWGDRQVFIDRALVDRLFPRVILELGIKQRQPWFNSVYSKFEEMKGVAEYEKLGEVIAIIKDQVVENLDEAYLRFIWKNRVLGKFVYDGLDDPNFYEAAKLYICTENLTVPRYIPIEIKNKLLRLIKEEEQENEDGGGGGGGDPDNPTSNDPLWPIDWNNLDDALTMMQNAVALNVKLPSSIFMKILRRNIQSRAELRQQFEDAKALFYWSNSDSRFTESWPSFIVVEAIERLRRWRLIQEEKLDPPIDIKMEEIEPEINVPTFVKFLEEGFVASKLRSLCQLQTRRFPLSSNWNLLWKEDPPYKELFLKFFALLLNPNASEENLLALLEDLLTTICQEQCASLIKELAGLQHSLLGIPETKIVTTATSNTIGQILKLQKRLKTFHFQSKHFLRELLHIYGIFERQSNVRRSEPEVVSETLKRMGRQFYTSGWEMELLDPQKQTLNNALLSLVSSQPEGSRKVFVLSIVGDVFKNQLKNQLFPPSGGSGSVNPHVFLGTYCTALLWDIPQGDVKSNYDAILILEMDDLQPQQLNYEQMRQISIANQLSDLTLMFTTGSTKTTFKRFDLPIVDGLSASPNHSKAADIIVTTLNEDANPSLEEHYTEFHKIVEQLRFQLGSRQENQLQRIQTRLLQGTLGHSLNVRPVGNSVQFDHGAIESLRKLIFDTLASTSSTNPPQTVSSLLQDLTSAWNLFEMRSESNLEVIKRFPMIFTNFQEMANHVEIVQPDFERVQEKLEAAILKHAADCRNFLNKGANKDSEEDSEDVLLTKILAHLEAAGDPTKCAPLNPSQEVKPCTFCESSKTMFDNFLNKHENDTVHQQNYNSYHSQMVQLHFSRLHRACANTFISNQKSITAIFEKVFTELVKSFDIEKESVAAFCNRVIEEICGFYADSSLLRSKLSVMESDLLQAYPQSPVLFQEFVADQNNSTFPTSLEYLLRGLEFRLKLQDIPGILLAAEFKEPFGPQLPYKLQFEFGMMRKCREMVQLVIREYETKYEETIQQETKWAGHLYVLRLLNNKVEELEENDVDPISSVQARRAELIAVIRRRVIGRSGIEFQNKE